MPAIRLTLLTIISISTSCLAQTSPEVHPDGRVTFRLKAPDAKEVRLRCEGVKDANLEKDEKGIWAFTTDTLEPDIYAYSFTVDGARVIDPVNPLLKYNLLNTVSQVHVPGLLSLAWEVNDVPHGQLHRHFFKSNITGDQRDFMVYTPPGYDPSARKRYPTLYLLHGFSDDATGWISAGFANVILDNLIARKQAKPMVVIMPLGYGKMEYVFAADARRREERQHNIDQFRETLFKEVMPISEKAYHLSSDRRDRAIAGLSMGGGESLSIGLNDLDRFAWIGAFSSGIRDSGYDVQYPSLDQKANDRLRLLWIACGEQDGLLAPNQKFCDWLKTRGIKYTWVATPGQHSFRVWRRNLAQFAALLFQP
jgi:enterochelin esterase family protein